MATNDKMAIKLPNPISIEQDTEDYDTPEYFESLYDDDDEPEKEYISHLEIEDQDGNIMVLPVNFLKLISKVFQDKIIVEPDFKIH